MGARPIDFHIEALKAMGAKVEEDHGFIVCTADKLTGTRIDLDFPSVGATENIMLSAVLAEGTTVITNAAKEPEIVDLQHFLNAMGADIKGAGSDTLVIQGRTKKDLHDVKYGIMPDRIVAGTYLMAAAITGGEIVLHDVVAQHLYPITSKLAGTGCVIIEEANRISLRAPMSLKPLDKLQTHPHPGFPDVNKGITLKNNDPPSSTE